MMAVSFATTAADTSVSPSRADLTHRLEAARVEQQIPGMSVAVVQDGEIVYSVALGTIARGSGTKVDRNTRFAIGSMGKPFTAAAVMMLAGEGRLSLSDPLVQHVPEIHEKYGGVTLHHMLGHLSGLPRDFKHGDSFTGKKLYKALARSKPDFEPGSSFAYSNTNYILLGDIVERVSGKPLHVFFQEKIFDPLGMSRTVCILPDRPVEDRARGHETADGVPLKFLPVRFGAGFILSTADDIARWDIGLSGGRVLPLTVQEKMWQPELPTATFKGERGVETRAGHGWFVKTVNGSRIVEHSGSLDGFFGTLVRHVDDSVSFVVLTSYERADLDTLVDLLRKEFLPVAAATTAVE